MLALDLQLLQVLCSCDGEDDLRSLRNLDRHRAADFFRTLQLEREIALHLVDKDGRMTYFLDEGTLV